MNIDGQYYHPTFLYESVWNVIGLLLLLWLRRRPFLRAGELFISYFIWYSIGRFFIEGLRTDSLDFTGPAWLAGLMNGLWAPMRWFGFEAGYMTYGGNVRISQLLAVLIVLAAIVLIVYRRKSNAAAEQYADPIVRQDGSLAQKGEPTVQADDQPERTDTGIDQESAATSVVSGEPEVERTDADGAKEPAVARTDADEAKEPAVARTDADEANEPAVGRTGADGAKEPAVAQHSDADEANEPTVGRANVDGANEPASGRTQEASSIPAASTAADQHTLQTNDENQEKTNVKNTADKSTQQGTK
jgi:hypothetical protein